MEGVALELGLEAVKVLVESFIQQVKEQKRLIGDAAQQAEELEADLKFLKEYLQDAVKMPKSSNVITLDHIRKVRDGIYRAEDAVDSFVVETAASDANCLSGGISKAKLLEIAKLVKSVCENVKEVRLEVEQKFAMIEHTLQAQGQGEYEGPPGKIKYAPIFEKEEKELRKRLTQEGEEAEAIFITGTHGSGKTTLAAKMFHDSEIQKQFSQHIWVSVSNATPRYIFLAVLRQINNKLYDHDLSSKNDWELSQLVARCLEGETFLIVLDNVSEIKEWKALQSAFERSCKKSRVLITSNNDETARFIDRHNHPIKLNPLSPNDSWSLLEWQVFWKINGCPSELVSYGKSISLHCKGLPQAIVFAGDTLARRDSMLSEMSERQRIWQDLSLGMITYFDGGMGSQNTNILSSFNKLPYHLRACFLYLGIFRQHSKFSVSKLIRLWIAEGFVQPHKDVALEKVAEGYLMDLINRNLVIIEDKRPDGSPKTCSINQLLYDFCKTEGGYQKENFLQEFRQSSTDGAFDPPINVVHKNRRVCIHDHISKFIPKFISSKPQSLKICLRSFVSHSDEVCMFSRKDVSNIRAAFKLLRVLDAKPIQFKKIPSDLCQLVLLKYVTLSLNKAILPASISRLQNVQTLVVHTPSHMYTLKIEADILKMIELRHLKTTASASLPKIGRASEGGERLQTLCDISPKSCTQDLFNRTPNLKKLGIRGQLAILLDKENELLGKLDKVQKLKLLNGASRGSNLEGLLQPSRFPSNLHSLTLSATSLNWGHISVLGSLPLLEELKLKDNAFVGEIWEVHEKGFPKLQTLQIERTQFKQWKSKKGHFPQLRRLKLFKCKELMEVPVELAHVPTFRELHFRDANEFAAECGKRIRQEKLRMKQTDKTIVFKLIM